MVGQIEIEMLEGLGIIRLDRPKNINALTPAMVETIGDALTKWASDGAIKAVLLEGSGEKGFCAGGDVRLITQMLADGQDAEAHRFFAAEYANNLAIANFPKPIVALTHGVVMGGGIGLASHARFRFTSHDAKFAMPESAIGFFCDVGVRWLLAKIPRHRALLFLLTGHPVGAKDAVALGLADAVYERGNKTQVRDDIIAATTTDDVEAALSALQSDLDRSNEGGSFCKIADSVTAAFESDGPDAILEALASASSNELFESLREKVKRNCPTTHLVSILSYDRAGQGQSLREVLAADLKLAKWVSARADFAEGVRAVLIDKDNAPDWMELHSAQGEPSIAEQIGYLLG